MEIANFCHGNPNMPIEIIRENYTEKFKKMITPEMLERILKIGK